MVTPRTSSLTVTRPSLLQSPEQPGPPGVTVGGGGVGVAQPQQGALGSLASQFLTSPGPHVGCWTQAPHATAKQLSRTVGQGRHWSEQYGVPVGAHVTVGVSVAVPL